MLKMNFKLPDIEVLNLRYKDSVFSIKGCRIKKVNV